MTEYNRHDTLYMTEYKGHDTIDTLHMTEYHVHDTLYMTENYENETYLKIGHHHTIYAPQIIYV